MRINAATCIACLWLASCFFLFFLRPFLEEPARTYAGHGMYSIFFAGIGAALIAFKIRTGSFPPFKAADRRANLAGFDLAGAPIWLATYWLPESASDSCSDIWVGSMIAEAFLSSFSAPLLP
jgi:hypothetical protein